MTSFFSLSLNGQVTFIFHQIAITIAILGVIGNILSIVVLSRKNLRKNSFSFFIRHLNVFDLIILLTQFRHWMAFTFDLDIKLVSSLLCKLADFSVFSCAAGTVLFLTLITIDRFVSIAFPKRFAIFQKRGFHACQVGLVVVYSFLCHLPLALNNELVVTTSYEPLTNMSVESKACVLLGDAGMYIFWITFFNPTLTIGLNIVLSILTILSIFKSRAKLRAKGKNKSSLKDRKFAITIIAQNVSCFLSKMPLVIFFTVNSYLGLDFEKFQMFFVIFATIYVIESADSFLVNYFFNSIFKNEVLALLGYKFKPMASSAVSRSTKE